MTLLLSIMFILTPNYKCFSEEGVHSIIENIIIKESLEEEVIVLNEMIEELEDINREQTEVISVMANQNEHLSEHIRNAPRNVSAPLASSRCRTGCKAVLVAFGALGGSVLTYMIMR